MAQQAKELGIAVKELYRLQGQYDAMTVIESENEDAVMGLLYSINAQGYMRTETMRGYNADSIKRALDKLAVGAARK